MIDLPHRLTDPIPLTVIDREGGRHELMIRKHGNTGSANFGNFRTPLIELGALREGRLGNATVGIFDTRKGTEVLKLLWSRADYHLCQAPGEIPEKYYRS